MPKTNGQQFQSSKRKAISYVRMSTDAQLKGNSLQRQIKLTEAYCEQNNLELVDELRDIGVSGYSGKNFEKGALGVFVDALRKNKIDPQTILLVENLDRLSRQEPLTAITQFNEILSYGIEIHTLFDNQVYTKSNLGSNIGLLFLSIGQMIRAHDESRTKSQRLKAAWEKKRQNPETYLTAKTPNWIVAVKDENGQVLRYELDPTEAKAIRKIFELTINQNMGSFAITRYLNANIAEYPKKKSSRQDAIAGWGDSYVKKILRSPTVFGEFQPMRIIDEKRVPAGKPISDYYPAVISEAEFRLAQDMQTQRTINGRGRVGKGFPNIFMGLAKCWKCHSSLRYRDRGDRPKGTITLHCSAAMQKRGACNARTIKYQEFEQRFFSAITDINLAATFQDKDFRRDELDLELAISSDQASATNLSTQINNLINELTEASLAPTLKRRMHETMNKLDAELVQTEERLLQNQSKLSNLRDATNSEVRGKLAQDVRDLLASTSDDRGSEKLRRQTNHSLKRLIDVIYIDSSPNFDLDDIRDGLIDEDELAPAFLEWFWENRTDRWKYQTPLEFVSSEYGLTKHQEFKQVTYIHFKNGQLRGLLPDGSFFAFEKNTGAEVVFDV